MARLTDAGIENAPCCNLQRLNLKTPTNHELIDAMKPVSETPEAQILEAIIVGVVVGLILSAFSAVWDEFKAWRQKRRQIKEICAMVIAGEARVREQPIEEWKGVLLVEFIKEIQAAVSELATQIPYEKKLMLTRTLPRTMSGKIISSPQDFAGMAVSQIVDMTFENIREVSWLNLPPVEEHG